jgi:hypothetical protein
MNGKSVIIENNVISFDNELKIKIKKFIKISITKRRVSLTR